MDFDYVLASHRLPIKFQNNQWVRSDGGLVTALNSSGAVENSLWVGHLDQQHDVGHEHAAMMDKRFRPIAFAPDHYKKFYNGFCNDIIWPLFHNTPINAQNAEDDYASYKLINNKFAETILMSSDKETPVWVHDYHLMLLPRIMKRYQPGRRVGFFLHIPWPKLDDALKLPHAKEIVRGLAAADVISFHTEEYRDNFVDAALHFLSENEVSRESLETRCHVTPIGINIEEFNYADPVMSLENSAKDKKQFNLIGVDRFDYSKGIDFKVQLIDKFLEKHPKYRGKLVLNQLLVPTRTEVKTYQDYRKSVEVMAKEVNDKWRTKKWQPIKLNIGRLTKNELLKFYGEGDVCLVTSIADGMNLVALEYLVTQEENKYGPLVIADTAGCSQYLDGAFVYRNGEMEEAVGKLYKAINTPYKERKSKLSASMKWIKRFTSSKWAQDNLKLLGIRKKVAINAKPA